MVIKGKKEKVAARLEAINSLQQFDRAEPNQGRLLFHGCHTKLIFAALRGPAARERILFCAVPARVLSPCSLESRRAARSSRALTLVSGWMRDCQPGTTVSPSMRNLDGARRSRIANSAAGRIGFETYPSMPAATQRSSSSFMAWAVTAIIGR